jgi:Tol biopolymer transport system component
LSKIELPRPPSRHRTVSLILLALLLLFAAGALAILLQRGVIHLPHRPPRVVSFSPADSARDVSTGAAIRITFSQPMDQAGTEARVRVDPPVEGHFAWTGETLAYHPTSTLAAGSTYTVTLDAGAPAQSGRGTLPGSSWRFQVGQPQLLYIARDEAGHFQLYLAGDPPTQLSAGETDVWDYAVHPEGTSIVYSADRGDDGADLWLVDRAGKERCLLLKCPSASCTAPAWSSDGTWIAYERQDLSASTIGVLTGLVVPEIWLLDPASGKTQPLYEDAPTPGRTPVWSPLGQRLAFYDLTELAIQIVDLDSGEQQLFDSLGGVGSWDPQGERMVLPEVSFHNQVGSGEVLVVDFATRSINSLSVPGTSEETMPRWSPDGAWIAYGRAQLADGTSTAGTQLWIMRPDGTGAHPLVTDAAANLGAYAWRPDGGAIAYVCLRVEEMIDPHPALWVVTLPDGETRQVVTEAILPGWLP